MAEISHFWSGILLLGVRSFDKGPALPAFLPCIATCDGKL